MTVTITSDSPYVLPAPTSSGTGEGQDMRVDPTPRVTISGENVRLLNA